VEPQSDDRRLSPQLLRFAGMGLEFIGSVAGGLLLGWIVDQLVGSFPTGSVVGAVAGLIVGVYNYFREAVQASKEARADDARKRRGSRDRAE